MIKVNCKHINFAHCTKKPKEKLFNILWKVEPLCPVFDNCYHQCNIREKYPKPPIPPIPPSGQGRKIK